MKKYSTFILLLLVLFFLAKDTREPKFNLPVSVEGIVELPIISMGREKPLDTAARSLMRVISGRSTFEHIELGRQPAIIFLLDTMFNPSLAREHPVFKIEHRDLAEIFAREKGQKYFSEKSILESYDKLREQYSKIAENKEDHTAYDRAVMRLWNSFNHYNGIAISFRPSNQIFGELVDEIGSVESLYPKYQQALQKQQAKAELLSEDRIALQAAAMLQKRYTDMIEFSKIGLFPQGDGKWKSVGESMLELLKTGELSKELNSISLAGVAYREKSDHNFRHNITNIWGLWEDHKNTIGFEYFYNVYEPFYKALNVYIIAFFCILFSWFFWTKELRRLAYCYLILAFIVHSFGMVARIIIQGTPPVTNLYSSAIFIGWFAVLIALVVEKIYKDGLLSLAASIMGVITLIIAHNLSMGGDTMEMMRAVLNSNFWLATHVITISIGYSASFVAGAIATLYLVMMMLCKNISKELASRLYNTVYGIALFSLLFSFIGTVLGGIWADVSWGRFWGWDPKENGALLIVLWNTLILHAKLAGWAKGKRLMQLAGFGNIVTAWSWFGTNMLGVGLHSYGFTESAFYYLLAFALIQTLILFVPQRTQA